MDPSINKDPFTEDEDRRLEEAQAKYGKRYRRCRVGADSMPGAILLAVSKLLAIPIKPFPCWCWFAMPTRNPHGSIDPFSWTQVISGATSQKCCPEGQKTKSRTAGIRRCEKSATWCVPSSSNKLPRVTWMRKPSSRKWSQRHGGSVGPAVAEGDRA